MPPEAIEIDESAQSNGLALILWQLIQSNIDSDSNKESAFNAMNGRIAIVAEDAQVGLTLLFNHGRLCIYDGIRGIPDITLRASSDDITNLSLIETEKRFGLPDIRKPIAKGIAKKILRGRIQLLGVLGHFRLFNQFGEILSVQH